MVKVSNNPAGLAIQAPQFLLGLESAAFRLKSMSPCQAGFLTCGLASSYLSCM